MGSGQVLQAPDDLEHVGPGVGIDVRIAGIGRETEAPGKGLPAEMRRRRDQEDAHEGLQGDAPGCLHQEDGAGSGEEDHPVQESQQAPRGLVRNRGVEDEHQKRVEPQEAQDPRVRPRDALRGPAGRAPGGREDEDEGLGPHGGSAGGEMDEQAQVVVPGVEVPGGGTGPIQVDPVGPHRVHDAWGVGQERGEEQRRHEGRREERQQRVPASHDTPDRRTGLPAPAVDEQCQRERQQHGTQREGCGLLRGVHQSRARARQESRAGARLPQIPAGREQRTEAEEDERDLVDVVPAVEDHGRRDRGQQGRDRSAGNPQEGTRPEVGGDESHPERGGNGPQGHLVDRDVPPRALEPGR